MTKQDEIKILKLLRKQEYWKPDRVKIMTECGLNGIEVLRVLGNIKEKFNVKRLTKNNVKRILGEYKNANTNT